MNEAEYLMKNYGDRGGYYPSRPQPRRITPSEISIILHTIRKPNSIIVYYSFKIIPTLKTWLKHANLHRSIDVNFIFDSARLGLSSSANILQIADVDLRVVFLLFLPCFYLCFRLVLTLETSEMSAIFQVHNQNNSTSSPSLLG